MRVCPKCRYREPPIWRNRFHRLYEQYCRIDELEAWEPKLAEKIREKQYVFEDGIKYRLNEDDMVLRIDAFLCRDPNPQSSSITEPNCEKHKVKLLPHHQSQVRLFEGDNKKVKQP